MSITAKLTATGKHLFFQGREDHAKVTEEARAKLIEQQKQLAKQQEEIERLTILSNWLIALSDNGCVINSHKFSQSELTKLLAKHNKGE